MKPVVAHHVHVSDYAPIHFHLLIFMLKEKRGHFQVTAAAYKCLDEGFSKLC